jgi:hypothetical protein
MTVANPEADLHRSLQAAREALLWELDELPEYDIRRPLMAAGASLPGLVKHLAGVELLYLGDALGRPAGRPAGRPSVAASTGGSRWCRISRKTSAGGEDRFMESEDPELVATEEQHAEAVQRVGEYAMSLVGDGALRGGSLLHARRRHRPAPRRDGLAW